MEVLLYNNYHNDLVVIEVFDQRHAKSKGCIIVVLWSTLMHIYPFPIESIATGGQPLLACNQGGQRAGAPSIVNMTSWGHLAWPAELVNNY